VSFKRSGLSATYVAISSSDLNESSDLERFDLERLDVERSDLERLDLDLEAPELERLDLEGGRCDCERERLKSFDISLFFVNVSTPDTTLYKDVFYFMYL